jgi:hypothetical protein
MAVETNQLESLILARTRRVVVTGKPGDGSAAARQFDAMAMCAGAVFPEPKNAQQGGHGQPCTQAPGTPGRGAEHGKPKVVRKQERQDTAAVRRLARSVSAIS